MALNIEKEHEMAEVFEATERLYRTADDRIVPEGDPDARWLYAVPGRRIPLEEAERYGLVGEPPAEEASDEPEEEPPTEVVDSSDNSEAVSDETGGESQKPKRRRRQRGGN